jgi:hypothetical protein
MLVDYMHDCGVAFSYFDCSSLYFLIVRIWYLWVKGLLLSAVKFVFVTCKYWVYYTISDEDKFHIIDFFSLQMWNHVILQEFWSHVIYQLFRYTCALLMKFPVLTCLKIFVSNTLFTSSCHLFIWVLFHRIHLFPPWNICILSSF